MRLGHYKVLRRIAEGGMGAVYEAEQDNPRRPVALKVIRPGFASPALLKRFTHEAQILGRLHHPGIAQVYEAGLADDGQPFFAMEFIRGLPLDEYSNRHGLDLAARIGLLAQVCDAVQHAHDQGVIHRDLKPANILVEETGLPKVLDFGVAHATGADLLTGAGLTQTGQLLGTPSYMSPEQVTADPAAIDHRADVYALGVILFELTVHRLPYRLENRPLAEVARLILELDAPLLGSIDPELRGDVETIVAQALEKDPARRYQSSADLASDLRRWLAHQPILARPPSALYHLRKFARRHTGLVGGVIATGVALVLGLVATLLFAVAEARQRGQAEQNARAAFDEKREAQFQAYRARLAAAAAALSGHDVADAARQLDAAPAGPCAAGNGGTCSSRLDDSSAVIPLPAEGVGTLLRRRGTVPGRDLDSPAACASRTWRAASTGPCPSAPNMGIICSSHADPPRTSGRGVGRRLRPLTCSTRRARCFAAWKCPKGSGTVPSSVSPDGDRLASRSWVRASGCGSRCSTRRPASRRRSATGHRDSIWSFTFSPDGTRLASGRRRRYGAAVGRGDRRDAGHVSGAHEQGPRASRSARTARAS